MRPQTQVHLIICLLDHAYEAFIQYILKQWISLKAHSDWPVKLRISIAIYLRATWEKIIQIYIISLFWSILKQLFTSVSVASSGFTSLLCSSLNIHCQPPPHQNAFNIGEVWNPVYCHGNKTFNLKLWSTFSRMLCKESSISDTNWLRYLFSLYLIKIWLSV